MTFWTVLISVGGSLIVAFGVSYLTRRSEKSKWLRERRYEAYANFVSTIDRWAIRIANAPDPADPEGLFYDEMVVAEAAVDLIGTPAVRKAMVPIRAKILDWSLAEDEAPSVAGQYWELHRAFTKAARDELHGRKG